MRLKIFLEGKELNLFDDEVIELNSSIANTDDVSKINSDYTKSFTVPASENNNRIFKHYYQADIDNTFDARTKKKGYIALDGVVFRIGTIRLEKVTVKKNKASSYTIVFFGNLVAIKDRIKNDELSSLNFTAFNFPANVGNKQTGLTFGIGANKEIIYNFISNQIPILTSNSISFDSNKLTPSIRLIEIIKAIEVKYSIIFSRHFFDRPEFKELYMWLKPESQKVYSFKYEPNELKNVFISPTKRTDLRITTTPSSGSLNLTYTFEVFRGTKSIHKIDLIGAYVYRLDDSTFQFPSGTVTETEYYIKITANQPMSFTSILGTRKNYIRIPPLLSWNLVNPIVNYDSGPIILGAIFIVNENMPKIKVVNFLKGIFQIFKLVAIPKDDGTIYINNIDDYYKEGKLIDITNYIDFEKYEVQRGAIANPIKFKYEEPTTILNKKFLENTGIAYGDEFLELADENGVLLEGDPLEVSLPFEQPVYELVEFKQFANGKALQYATILDKDLKDVNPKPIIFYNNTVELPNNGTYTVKLDNTELVGRINVPSQTFGLDNPNASLNWGVEYSVWNGNTIDKTLFSKYWQSYILSVFNIKKRLFKFDAILPSSILLNLKLNDILFAKERYYRINDFTINLNTRQTTLNLTNVFDPNFGLFIPSQKEVYFSKPASTFRIYVSNANIMNIALQDLGFGTLWLTAVKNGNFIDITITENISIPLRELFINVNNGAGQSFQIYINQL